MTRGLALMFALAVLAARLASAQQLPDSSYDTHVARPAFAANGPRVLFDEAHHNFHTSTGRYLPFARLMSADGFRLEPNAAPFSAATLRGADILVIANALGHEAMRDTAASHPAFADLECMAVRDWVRGGGALLLIADHAPMGDAARGLASRFGVDMRAAYTIDPEHGADGNASLIMYAEGYGLAVTHPIIRGRDSTERVTRVLAFTGQSLSGPPGAVSLLTLGAKAEDLLVRLGEGIQSVSGDRRRPAGGRSQGLAFTFGRGRVVVLGEAAMMSAQLAGPRRIPMGMNAPGSDDRTFALNVMRWLGGALR
jgi:hypothetical protein